MRFNKTMAVIVASLIVCAWMPALALEMQDPEPGGYGGGTGGGTGGGSYGSGSVTGGSFTSVYVDQQNNGDGSTTFSASVPAGGGTLQTVTVTCGSMCQGAAISVGGSVVTIIADGQWVAGGINNIPGSPGYAGQTSPTPTPTPPQPDPACLAKCSTINSMAVAQCTLQANQVQAQLAWRPYGAAVAGALTGFFFFRQPFLTGGAAWAVTASLAAQKVAAVSALCNSNAAQNYLFCMNNTCHALGYVVPLFLVRRRRKDDETESVTV